MLGYICVTYPFIYLCCAFQEECLKRLDNKPSCQPKIKRKNGNPHGEIVTSDAVYEKVFENT